MADAQTVILSQPQIDAEPFSPEWWVATLESRLRRRWEGDPLNKKSGMTLFEDYYEGTQKNDLVTTSKYREAFAEFLERLSDNWASLIVSAVEERLEVDGFRWGEDKDADKQAWGIWEDNDLDIQSSYAHRTALITGESYALVNPFDQEGQSPEITVEHPKETIVAYEPGSARRRRLAALKSFTDDWGERFAYLYLPDAIYKYRAARKADSLIELPPGVNFGPWAPFEVDNEPWPLENPLGVVPVIPLLNNPLMLGGGRSEMLPILSAQDAINSLRGNLMVAAEASAYRQRYVIGIEPIRDKDGNEISPFDPGADEIWWANNPNAKFGEFEATNLENYVKAIQDWVMSLASQTRTPPHFFWIAGQYPSAESIKASEAGLTKKVGHRARGYGVGWVEAIRLAFLVLGDVERGRNRRGRTIWHDPEIKSDSEFADSLIKAKSFGVEDEILQERWGMDSQERTRNAAARAKRLQMEALFGPPPELNAAQPG